MILCILFNLHCNESLPNAVRGTTESAGLNQGIQGREPSVNELCLHNERAISSHHPHTPHINPLNHNMSDGQRVSGGAMYDPARDAWADRDADAGSWPQRRSVDQQAQSHSPPAPAQAPRPVSPVHAIPIPGPGPVSTYLFSACLSCAAWLFRVR